MAYIVSLKQFDGPLDLLLTLVHDAKIDIKEIFVSEITQQYLDAMQNVDELDMDTASEFLAMAATILEIKSRALVPVLRTEDEENGESPEQMLIRRLEEYKLFKEKSQDLRTLETTASLLYTKFAEEFPLPPPEIELINLTSEKLYRAFLRVMERAREREAFSQPAGREIRRDAHTVRGCMRRILSRVKGRRVLFTELFDDAYNREEIVTMFLALLEMLKDNTIRVIQNETMSDIWLEEAQAV